jgi:hypothetical protein
LDERRDPGADTAPRDQVVFVELTPQAAVTISRAGARVRFPQVSVTARPGPRPRPPEPSVRRALLGMAAAFGVALVAAYQAVVLSAELVGLLPAVPLGLLTFVVVGAVAVLGAARLDADVLSR